MLAEKLPPKLARKEVDLSRGERQCVETLLLDDTGEVKHCKFVDNHVLKHETYDGRTWETKR